MNVFRFAALVITFFSISSTFVNAQDSRWRVGFSFGSSQSELVGSPLIERFFEPIQTFSPALSVQYIFNDNFSLLTEARFERKGMTADQDLFGETGNLAGFSSQTYHFDYLVVPMLLRLSTGDKWQLFGNIGPYVAYLMNQEVIYDTSFGGTETSVIEDESSRYKSIDVGFSAGLGIGILLTERIFVNVEARNNYGLTNVRDDEVFGSEVLNTKSTQLMLGASYRF